MSELARWIIRNIESGNRSYTRGPGLNPFNASRGFPVGDVPRWGAFRAFLRRPWFRRVWVIQEYVLPKNALTICGGWQLDGTDIPMFISVFSSIVPVGSLFTDAVSDETSEHDIKDSISMIQKHMVYRLAFGHSIAQSRPKTPQEHMNLINLVDWAYICDTTDPRDRFFGVLGIANDVGDASSLQPVYGKTLDEVIDIYVSFIIEKGSGSSLLKLSDPVKNLHRHCHLGTLTGMQRLPSPARHSSLRTYRDDLQYWTRSA